MKVAEAVVSTWEDRQRRFKEFDAGVFNILKLALVNDMTEALFAQVTKDIRTTMPPDARTEMMIYTDRIDIYVHGRQWRTGWWWGKKTVWKYISASITFEPYRSDLSAWTDPKAPDGVVFFQ